MTVMAHPRKDKLERWRVFDKELRINEYFGKATYGTLAKAKKEAHKRQKEVDAAKRAAQLQRESALGTLFNKDGSVKGLYKVKRIRDDRPEDEHFFRFIVITSPKVQEHGYASLNKYDFDTAYAMITERLMATHKIESTPELRILFKKAKRHHW